MSRTFKVKPLTRLALIAAIALTSLFLSPGSLKAFDEGYVWELKNPLPTGSDLESVDAYDANHVWAVGSYGTICFYNGSSWSVQPSGTTNYLWDVSALAPNHVWAVGTGGIILFYNGASWCQQPSGTTAALYGVYALDPTHVWAVGEGGTILFFNGSTWSAQPSGTTDSLTCISVISYSHAWAGSESDTGDSSILFFNGDSWSIQASFPVGIRDISALDSTHVWAVGGLPGFLFYDGSNWSQQSTINNFSEQSVFALDANHVWIVGHDGFISEPSTIEFYDGNSWSTWESDSALGLAMGLMAVSASDDSHVWAVGYVGVILFNDGSSWSSQANRFGFEFYDVDALDSTHCWMVGAGESGWYDGYILFYDGNSFSIQYSEDNACITSVCALDANNVWAVGKVKVGSEYVSVAYNYDGVSWNKQYIEFFDGWLSEITAVDPTHVWAVGTEYGTEGTILFYDGASWSTQASGLADSLGGIFALDANHVWAVGRPGPYGSRPGVIFFFDGSSWKEQVSETTNCLSSVFAVDANHVWTVGEEGFTLFFNGTSWSEQDSGSTNNLCWLSAVDANHVWAVGYNGTICFYNGTSWTKQISGTINKLSSVSAVDANHVWVVGSAGVILFGSKRSAPSTWYLAEGCTGGDFETWVLVQNPNASPVTVDLTFMTSTGPVPGPQDVTIAANSRQTFYANDYVSDYNVSTQVTAEGGGVICERAMYGGNRTWAHDSIGVTAPASTWYLAEGCTGGDFETWVLVQNPNASPVTVDLTFMTSTGPVPGPQDVTIAANSRQTFYANDYVSDYNVSTQVTVEGGGVICERAMYGGNRTWAHDSIGVTAPASTWYLAEGCTGGDFETWVLVQNPNASPVTVDLTFMTSTGPVPGPQDVTIAANSRQTFYANDYVSDYNVSTQVTAEGGGVICERAMYGGNRTWAHDSIGVTAPASNWYLAEGCTGGDFETWVLVQNPNASPVTVDLTFMTSTGPVPGPQDVTIAANSRQTFYANDYVSDYNVSTQVTAEGGGVICERAMYGGNRTWAHDSVGYAQ